MSINLNTDKRIWVLKKYWKSQNSETVRRKWVETFGTPAPKLYSKKARSADDLKNYIRDAFQEINAQSDLCEEVCPSVRDRLQSCVNQKGKQFEHLR